MRQEHKDEAAVLVERMAQNRGRGNFTRTWDFYEQLAELVTAVARTLPAPRCGGA